MSFSLIALRNFTRALAWVALITFAIGAIFARDLVLVRSVQSSNAAASAPAPEKRVARARPSGISKRAAWSPTDPPDDDDETDEDSDTVAPTNPQMMLPAVLTDIAPAMLDAQLARFLARTFFVPIARRHATPVRGPPLARALGRSWLLVSATSELADAAFCSVRGHPFAHARGCSCARA